MTLRRSLTTREKLMMVLLAVLIIIVGYFKLVWEPVTNGVIDAESDTSFYQSEILAQSAKISNMQELEANLEEIKASGQAREIPTANNLTNLMKELDRILSSANEYTLSFDATSVTGYILLRPITLTMTTDTYAQSRAIIDDLLAGYPGQISDVNCTMSAGTDGAGLCTTTLKVTYFERTE